MEYPAETAVTLAVTARVKRLRVEARLSGTALADGMVKIGFRWNQSTVAKLESGRRRSITVDELLALAVVLGVPPVWLVADPKTDGAVPLAEGVEVDPWTFVLWVIGKRPLSGDSPGTAWDEAKVTIGQAYQVASALELFQEMQKSYEIVAAFKPPDSDEDRDREAEAAKSDRRILGGMVAPLRGLAKSGAQLPPLPDDVVKRASELGIDLPDQGGEG